MSARCRATAAGGARRWADPVPESEGAHLVLRASEPGAHATLDEAGTMTLTAFVGRPDGGAWLRDTLTVAGGGTAPEALGAQVAARLVAAGAQEVLGR